MRFLLFGLRRFLLGTATEQIVISLRIVEESSPGLLCRSRSGSRLGRFLLGLRGLLLFGLGRFLLGTTAKEIIVRIVVKQCTPHLLDRGGRRFVRAGLAASVRLFLKLGLRRAGQHRGRVERGGDLGLGGGLVPTEQVVVVAIPGEQTASGLGGGLGSFFLLGTPAEEVVVVVVVAREQAPLAAGLGRRFLGLF